MADLQNRAKKLANARKKLREFQQHRASPTSHNKNLLTRSSSVSSEDVQSVASSVHTDDIVPNHTVPTNETNGEFSAPHLAELGNGHNDNPHGSYVALDIPLEPDPVAPTPNENSVYQPILSSSESIRQISMQINGLVSRTNELFGGGESEVTESRVSELERRNRELASLLEAERGRAHTLEQQARELTLHASTLQQRLHRERTDASEEHRKDIVSLKEQLQVHIQTIGILVAEKTELQSTLQLSQQTAKQKAAEVEELQSRLKACRQRVTDLERDLAQHNTGQQQAERNYKEQAKEAERLQLELYNQTKRNEETAQEMTELSERLSSQTREYQHLEEQYGEARKLLDLAELRLRQLSGPDGNSDSLQQLERLQQDNINLEKKLGLTQDTVQKLNEERDRLSDNYQHLTQQFQHQAESFQQRLNIATEQQFALQAKNREMEETITELERRIRESAASPKQEQSQLQAEEVEQWTTRINDLETERSQLITTQQQMAELLQERDIALQKLETTVQELRDQQLDGQKLLETLQSDKVAVSRAVAQNKELKRQLEELQDAFVKMNNDRVQLTEKMQAEQHVSKELGERLTQQEEELQELRDQLAEKTHRIELLQKSGPELTKDAYRQEQVNDRIRQFEAQGHLSELLQQELEQAQQRVKALTTQNAELRTLLANQVEQMLKGAAVVEPADRQDTRKDDMVASLSASVRQLELERNQLLEQLAEQTASRDTVRHQLQTMRDGSGAAVVPVADYDKTCRALKQLEEKFTHTMDEIAELSDQKQQLEHLVIQLQGETETIGEYVTLYQVQRGLLRQRAKEKDDYIAQLARDREELKNKLTHLQDLVHTLLYEKQTGTTKRSRKINGEATGVSVDQLTQESTKEVINPTPVLAPPQETAPNPASTARQIIDLISEIETTNLVDPPISDSFHPCTLCSGRLLHI